MKKLIVVALAAAIAATSALAATRSEHHFSLTFSTKAAGKPTGIKFMTDRYAYKAPPAGTAVDRVATTTFIMAPGTRTRTAGYRSCSAQALLDGRAKTCSKVGTGTATVVSGNSILDPGLANVAVELYVKNAGLLAFLPKLNQVIELSMKGNKIVAAVPQKCLDEKDCTQGEFVLKVLKSTIKPGTLITTPKTCPKSGKWTNEVLYKYANGDTEHLSSTSRCKG
jgi:hypothetical protein